MTMGIDYQRLYEYRFRGVDQDAELPPAYFDGLYVSKT